jgi:two-component system KDP operon response regulator KdpE
MTRILIVDDNDALARALVINFRARGYQVDAVSSGAAALKRAASTNPDLVVLDLGLPDMDGLEVLAGLRGWTSLPVIVLSARTTSDEKVRALEAGADDYVTKPFNMNELVARVKAAIRRGASARSANEQAIVETGAFTIDFGAGVVIRNGQPVKLTPTEWHVLEVLATNVGKLVSQDKLLTDVWGAGYEGQTNYLRVYLAQLRRKLEHDPAHPKHLITEPGLGYRLMP